MKISDENLAAKIKDLTRLINRPCHVMPYGASETRALLEELQQHREEKRWRKIEEELPPLELSSVLIFKPGMKRPQIMDVDIIHAGQRHPLTKERDDQYFWWPLPTDLPEEEE